MIETEHLERTFNETVALTDVTLAARPGAITAVVGPNGAGKTTLFRIISGLLQPTAGTCRVLGADSSRLPLWVRGRLGVLPDPSGVYESMSWQDYLRFFGRLYGLSDGELARRIQAWSRRLELDRFPARARLKTLSRGTRQRVLLTRTFLHDPDVLVLDEPTSTLDPENVDVLRHILGEMRDEGKTILTSSHDLASLEKIADTVIFLIDGRVRHVVENVKEGARTVLTVLGRPPALNGGARVETIDGQDDLVRVVVPAGHGEENVGTVRGALSEAGCRVLSSQREDLDLEELYLRVVREGRGR